MGRIDPQLCCVKDGIVMARPAYDNSLDWVDTGDIGWVDQDGFLWLRGRSKEIIKRNGRTIFPFEIECALQTAPGIMDVAAYAIHAMTNQESIGLVYVGDLDPDQVRDLCRQRLSTSLQPTQITKLPELPLQCGKVRRGTLDQYVTTLQ